MTKTFTANCGNAILLRDKEGVLDRYDSYIFNCGSILMSEEVNASLAGKDVMFNCGSTKIIPTPKNLLYLEQRVTISDAEKYADKFLICKSLVVTPEGTEGFARLEGLMVSGKTFLPQSIAEQNFPTGNPGQIIRYPDEAQLVFEEVWLEKELRKWRPKTKYFVANRLFATDEEALASLERQGITFICDALYTTDRALEKHGGIFEYERLEIIPDGHRVITKKMSLIDLYATGGDRIYLIEGLTLLPDDSRHLPLFSSIIVKGRVTAPLESLAQIKAIISATSFKVYEGTPMLIDGVQIIGHEMFQEALAEGLQYWVEVDGVLILQDDVTAQDVKAIASIQLNGVMLAPNATQAHIKAVAKKIDGLLLPGLSELTGMADSLPEETRNNILGMVPPHIRKILGFPQEGDGETTFTFNGGSYVLA